MRANDHPGALPPLAPAQKDIVVYGVREQLRLCKGFLEQLEATRNEKTPIAEYWRERLRLTEETLAILLGGASA